MKYKIGVPYVPTENNLRAYTAWIPKPGESQTSFAEMKELPPPDIEHWIATNPEEESI